MLRYSPKKKELDARDIVARANYAEIMADFSAAFGYVAESKPCVCIKEFGPVKCVQPYKEEVVLYIPVQVQ